MTPEEIIANIYKQCAERGRIDLIPKVVKKMAETLRTLADQCDKLVDEELSKVEVPKKKKGKKDGNSGE